MEMDNKIIDKKEKKREREKRMTAETWHIPV